MQSWKPDEIEFLLSNIENGTKDLYDLFCDTYGMSRSYDSIQKKTKKLRDAFSDFDDDTPIAIEKEVDTLLYKNAILGPYKPSTAEKKAKKEETKLWLESLIDLSKNLKFAQEAKVVQSTKPSLVIVLSDTHFGKVTKWFNLEEAKKRMLSIPDRLDKKNLPDFDEIVLILAGDMVEGEDIYPNQNSHIECAAIDQVKVCAATIWELGIKLRIKFDCSVRYETVPGNHGRVSKTANERTNWDNVVYHILSIMTTMYGDEKISINCNFEEFSTFKIKSKVGMAYHRGVKHTGTASMREKIAGWKEAKKFDFMVHGHWHEWHIGNWLGRIVVGNGCMCGPDDLAERMGQEASARQAYFFIDKEIWGFSYFEWDGEE